MNRRPFLALGVLAITASTLFSACGGDDSSSSPTPPSGGAGGSGAPDATDEGTAGTGGAVTPDGGEQDAAPEASAEDASDSAAPDGAVPDGGACGRTPRPEDADRMVVISHPYAASSDPSPAYSLLRLTAAGELSETGTTFEMGRSITGDVVFTPDGELGIVAQEDGTLGELKLDASGAPEVLQTAFKGGFYAERLVMHPSGDRLYVLDSEWANIGGGVYEVQIGCDGTLTDKGRIIEAKLPYGMVLLPNDSSRAVVAAKDLLGSAAGDDAHLVSLAPTISRIASVDSFADDEQIIAAAAVTADGKYVLLGDNNEYSGLDNRVAVIQVDGDTLVQRQMLTPMLDPFAIVTSPFGSTAIVVSGYGDGIFVLDYDASSATTPFSVRGELTYDGPKPQLPARAVMIERGQLKGRVLVAENTAVRMVQFTAQGAGVTDVGPFSTGSGLDAITGAIGVQP